MRGLLIVGIALCACSGEKRPDLESALALLRSADADDRFEAVVQLGGIASEDATKALFGAIKDEDPAVRLLAGIALVAADAGFAGRTIVENDRADGASLLTPAPKKASADTLSGPEQLVYADPWFAGTLLPGCLMAARDEDERVRALAIRALRVAARNAPRSFRETIRTAAD
jgi:hypothetical protein